jgi:hypothetical protein
MSKLNGEEKILKKQLMNELKKSPTYAYLASELDKFSDMVVKILLKDFSTLNKRMIVMSMIDPYNIIADRWCSNYENCIANFPFPYETKTFVGNFTKTIYTCLRKILIVRAYTEAYLNESDSKKTTEDHYLIIEQAISKILLELFILGEKGRYDSESFLLHIMRLCNVIKCTRVENNLLKENLDDDGLRHLDGYLKHNIVLYNNDKRLKTCDNEPAIINFADLPSNRDLFITDMYYPELKKYTNRMFVSDYKKLLKLGKPKI